MSNLESSCISFPNKYFTNYATNNYALKTNIGG